MCMVWQVRCVHGKYFALQEKQKLLDEIEELSLRLSDEQENRRKLGDRLSHERHQFQKDKEATQEVNTSPGTLAVTQQSPRTHRAHLD